MNAILVVLYDDNGLYPTFVAQAYSEASVIVDLWLPGTLRICRPQSTITFAAFRVHIFFKPFCFIFIPVLGAETVSHEAILFDVIVVVAGLGSFCIISIVLLFIFLGITFKYFICCF